MATLEERAAAAEKRAQEAAKKAAQLKRQVEDREAREMARMLKGSRGADTRRKILAGAMVLAQAEADEAARAQLMEQLGSYLTRADDRALFGLAPLLVQPHELAPNF